MKNYERPSDDELATLPENQPKRKKIRKKKDPNKPKGTRSAYIFFTMEKREAVAKMLTKKKEKYEGKEGYKYKDGKPTAATVMKAMGRAWRKIDPKLKKKYEKMAADDKARYQKEKEEWMSGQDTDAKSDEDEEAGPKVPPKPAKALVSDGDSDDHDDSESEEENQNEDDDSESEEENQNEDDDSESEEENQKEDEDDDDDSESE